MAFADLVAQPRTGQLVQKNYTNFDRRTEPSNSDPGHRTSTH